MLAATMASHSSINKGQNKTESKKREERAKEKEMMMIIMMTISNGTIIRIATIAKIATIATIQETNITEAKRITITTDRQRSSSRSNSKADIINDKNRIDSLFRKFTKES